MMSYEQEQKFEELARKCLRTFPPINKNGNSIITKIKRNLLLIRMALLTDGDPKQFEEAIQRMINKYELLK